VLRDLGVDVDGLPLAALWRGCEALDGVFAGQPYATVKARCEAFLGRYLARRFPEEAGAAVEADALRRRLRLRELEGRS